MTDPENGWMIICGVMILVILFNVGLAISALRGRRELFLDALRDLRNPWQKENDALADLRERVDKLQRESEGEEPPDGNR